MLHTTTDARFIEQRMLELAYTTDAKITAPALAYYAPCSIEDAANVLDDLATRGRLTMDVQDDGSIVYELLGRAKLASPPPERPRLTRSVETHAYAPVSHRYRGGRSPLVAATLSAFIPGAGHLYAGSVVAAILWFLVVGAAYSLIVPGVVLHLFSIVSAAAAASRRNVLAAPPSRPLLAGASW